MSDAAAECHVADHNELIGSSVVSLGPHEKCCFRSALSRGGELRRQNTCILELELQLSWGRAGSTAIKPPALSVIGEAEGK